MRELFPELRVLDGKVLPKVKGFDVDLPSGKLPKQLPGYAPSAEGRDLAVAFLTEYFACFDDRENRVKLAAAYHERATLSMISMSNKSKSTCLSKCRSLRNLDDNYNRNARVWRGRDAVIETLSELPSVTTDLSSLIIDVPFVLPTLLVVEVCGVMRDSSGALVKFSRTFALVPSGTGVLVTNDTAVLWVPPPIPTWERLAFVGPQQIEPPVVKAEPAAPLNPGASAAVVPGVASAIPPAPVTLTQEAKLAMTERFALESGLKPDWALCCLEENEWNYDVAARAFSVLQERGAVPAEAFNVVVAPAGAAAAAAMPVVPAAAAAQPVL